MDQKHPTLKPIAHKSVKPNKTNPSIATIAELTKKTKKVKLTNKLSVSPLTMELRALGPITPQRVPHFMKENALTTKYSHREVNALNTTRVSPSTHVDFDKPSLLSR